MTAATAKLVPALLTLGVTDLDTSAAFYRDVLGLDIKRREDSLHVSIDGFTLTLDIAAPVERGKMRFGFRVETAADVDLGAKRLQDAGARIVTGPADHEGQRTVYVSDPDDYTIEIFAHL